MPPPASAWPLRRSASPLRVFVVDLSVGRDPSQLIVLVNPEFVERDGTQLEEEGCLSVPGFNATVLRPSRAVITGLDREERRRPIEGTRPAGTRVPARNGPSRRPPVRRPAARHQAGRDRPQDPEAAALRQMVTSPPLRIVFFGTPGFRGADTAETDRFAARGGRQSCHSPIVREAAASRSSPRRPKWPPTRGRRFRCCSRRGFETRRFSPPSAISPSTLAWSPPTERSCPTSCWRSRGWG